MIETFELLSVIQAIVRDEMPARRAPSLGLVTTVTTNEGGGDEHNLEANVRLQGSDLELQRVPVAAGGSASPPSPSGRPRAVVGFVDGDVNGAGDRRLRSTTTSNHPPDGRPTSSCTRCPTTAEQAAGGAPQLTNGNRLTVTDDKVTVKMGATDVVVESDAQA